MEFKDNVLNEKIDASTEELSDISLADSKDEQSSNKKQYLMLGVALLTLFIITIIVIRFMSNVNEETNSLTPKEAQIKQDNILENINAEQRYQEIIKQRAQTLQDEEATSKQEEVKSEPAPEPAPKKVIETKKVELKPLKKEASIPAPKTTSFVKEPVVKPLKGSFIQLGAFSKYPSSKYLKNIKNRGYNYVVHKVDVKGKTFHKVLVGPYKSKTESRQILNEIKKDLKSPKAFIFK